MIKTKVIICRRIGILAAGLRISILLHYLYVGIVSPTGKPLEAIGPSYCYNLSTFG